MQLAKDDNIRFWMMLFRQITFPSKQRNCPPFSLAIILPEHKLLNFVAQEGFFPVSFFDKTTVNMTSYFDVEEETDVEDDRQENFPKETNKTLAALEAIPMRLN